MVKVSIDNELVFEGVIGRLGGGGTKTAYGLQGTDYAVLVPNEVDGLQLEKVFPRICYEEETMFNYLSTNDIAPSLPVKTCTVTLDNGKTLPALYAPCFESFMEAGAYVLDSKEPYSCCWNPRLCMNPTFYDVDSWVPIFEPLIQDLKRLVGAGIVPLGDCLNFVITTPASKYHVNPAVPYQVRFFGFDFSSKRYVSERVQAIASLEPGTFLKPAQDLNYLSEALDLAVDLVVTLTRTQVVAEETTEQVDAIRALYQNVLQRLLQ